LAPEDNCPCGSRLEAQRCYRVPDHSWVAERPPALLTGPRTGYANRRRHYACASNDCSEDLTLERFLSDDLLEAISVDNKVVMVEGAAWQGPEAKQETIGVKSLSSR
jgi:uncharacterized protein YchJ